MITWWFATTSASSVFFFVFVTFFLVPFGSSCKLVGWYPVIRPFSSFRSMRDWRGVCRKSSSPVPHGPEEKDLITCQLVSWLRLLPQCFRPAVPDRARRALPSVDVRLGYHDVLPRWARVTLGIGGGGGGHRANALFCRAVTSILSQPSLHKMTNSGEALRSLNVKTKPRNSKLSLDTYW